jgi:hypothetical protein
MPIGPDIAQRGERRALVRRIGVGIDEDDGECLGALGKQFACRNAHSLGIYGRTNAAVSKRALIDFETEVAVDHRNEIAPQPPGMAAVAAAHFQHIAKSARGDQTDPSPFAFQQRVRADRRAVHHGSKGGDTAQLIQTVEKAGRFIAALRGHLCRSKRACGLVVPEKIREGAADIDTDDSARMHIHATAPLRSAAVAAPSTVPSSRTATR